MQSMLKITLSLLTVLALAGCNRDPYADCDAAAEKLVACAAPEMTKTQRAEQAELGARVLRQAASGYSEDITRSSCKQALSSAKQKC